MSDSMSPQMSALPACIFCNCSSNFLEMGDVYQYRSSPDHNLWNEVRKIISTRPALTLGVDSSILSVSCKGEAYRIRLPQDLGLCTKDTQNRFMSTTGNAWAHSACALYSRWRDDFESTGSDSPIICALQTTCHYCNRYGGSVYCSADNCNVVCHLFCASVNGCFLDRRSNSMLCPSHNLLVDPRLTSETPCSVCSLLTNRSSLLTCWLCGNRFHYECLSPAGVPCKPLARFNWHCAECRTCMLCGASDQPLRPAGDRAVLCCDGCDRMFHKHCLQAEDTPILIDGQCTFCRTHVSVDSYLDPPPEMQLSVHLTPYKLDGARNDDDVVDEDEEMAKSTDEELTNSCCAAANDTQSEEGIEMEGSESSTTADPNIHEFVHSIAASCRKRPSAAKGKRKKLVRLAVRRRVSRTARGRRLQDIHHFSSDIAAQADEDTLDEGLNSIFKPTGEVEDHPVSVVVFDKAKTKGFFSETDICARCGSAGLGSEGSFIFCSQCGQSFHTYCVDVSVSSVNKRSGWRCLRCTVCEHCGLNVDESKLILCDDCDLSFHLYCLSPPLASVPRGAWRCKWCITCSVCGTRFPGPQSDWVHSVSRCGPCHSTYHCQICNAQYATDDLMIRCSLCNRWSHASCDGIEEEAECKAVADDHYVCQVCRDTKCAQDVLPAFFELGVFLNHAGFRRRTKQMCATSQKLEPTQSSMCRYLSRAESTPSPQYPQSRASSVADAADEEFLLCQDDKKSLVTTGHRGRTKTKIGLGGFYATRKSAVNRELLLALFGLHSKEAGEAGGGPDLSEMICLTDDLVKQTGGSARKRRAKRSKAPGEVFSEVFPKDVQQQFLAIGPLVDIDCGFVCEGQLLPGEGKPCSDLKPCPLDVEGDPGTPVNDTAQQKMLESFLHDWLPVDIVNQTLSEATPSLPIERHPTDQVPARGSKEIRDVVKMEPAARECVQGDQRAFKACDDISAKVGGEMAFSHQTDPSLVINDFARQFKEVSQKLLSAKMASAVPLESYGGSTVQRPVTAYQYMPQQSARYSGEAGTYRQGQPMEVQKRRLYEPVANPVEQYQREMSCDSHEKAVPAPPKAAREVLSDRAAAQKRMFDRLQAEEVLGQSATMAPIIYCKTRYPNLADSFPDGGDRAREMQRIWRRLPTKEKAPFTECAKRNRANKRMTVLSKLEGFPGEAPNFNPIYANTEETIRDKLHAARNAGTKAEQIGNTRDIQRQPFDPAGFDVSTASPDWRVHNRLKWTIGSQFERTPETSLSGDAMDYHTCDYRRISSESVGSHHIEGSDGFRLQNASPAAEESRQGTLMLSSEHLGLIAEEEDEELKDPILVLVSELVTSVCIAVLLWPEYLIERALPTANPDMQTLHIEHIIELVAHGGGALRRLRSRRRRSESNGQTRRKDSHPAGGGKADGASAGAALLQAKHVVDDSLRNSPMQRTISSGRSSRPFAQRQSSMMEEQIAPSSYTVHQNPPASNNNNTCFLATLHAHRESFSSIIPSARGPPAYPDDNSNQLPVLRYEHWISDRDEMLKRTITIVDDKLNASKRLKAGTVRRIKAMRRDNVEIPQVLVQELQVYTLEVDKQTKLNELLRHEHKQHLDIMQNHRCEQIRRANAAAVEAATHMAIRGNPHHQMQNIQQPLTQSQLSNLSASSLLINKRLLAQDGRSQLLRRTCSTGSNNQSKNVHHALSTSAPAAAEATGNLSRDQQDCFSSLEQSPAVELNRGGTSGNQTQSVFKLGHIFQPDLLHHLQTVSSGVDNCQPRLYAEAPSRCGLLDRDMSYQQGQQLRGDIAANMSVGSASQNQDQRYLTLYIAAANSGDDVQDSNSAMMSGQQMVSQQGRDGFEIAHTRGAGDGYVSGKYQQQSQLLMHPGMGSVQRTDDMSRHKMFKPDRFKAAPPGTMKCGQTDGDWVGHINSQLQQLGMSNDFEQGHRGRQPVEYDNVESYRQLQPGSPFSSSASLLPFSESDLLIEKGERAEYDQIQQLLRLDKTSRVMRPSNQREMVIGGAPNSFDAERELIGGHEAVHGSSPAFPAFLYDSGHQVVTNEQGSAGHDMRGPMLVSCDHNVLDRNDAASTWLSLEARDRIIADSQRRASPAASNQGAYMEEEHGAVNLGYYGRHASNALGLPSGALNNDMLLGRPAGGDPQPRVQRTLGQRGHGPIESPHTEQPRETQFNGSKGNQYLISQQRQLNDQLLELMRRGQLDGDDGLSTGSSSPCPSDDQEITQFGHFGGEATEPASFVHTMSGDLFSTALIPNPGNAMYGGRPEPNLDNRFEEGCTVPNQSINPVLYADAIDFGDASIEARPAHEGNAASHNCSGSLNTSEGADHTDPTVSSEPKAKKRRVNPPKKGKSKDHSAYCSMSADDLLEELRLLGKPGLLEPKIDISVDPFEKILGGSMGLDLWTVKEGTIPDYYGRFLIEQSDTSEQVPFSQDQSELGQQMDFVDRAEHFLSDSSHASIANMTGSLTCDWGDFDRDGHIVNLRQYERGQLSGDECTMQMARVDESGPRTESRKSDNVSVTLTLTTEACNNVESVMSALADLLNIRQPMNWEFVDDEPDDYDMVPHDGYSMESRDASTESMESYSAALSAEATDNGDGENRNDVKDDVWRTVECVSCQCSSDISKALIVPVCSLLSNSSSFRFESGLAAAELPLVETTNRLGFCNVDCLSRFVEKYKSSIASSLSNSRLNTERRLLQTRRPSSTAIVSSPAEGRRSDNRGRRRPGQSYLQYPSGLSWFRMMGGEGTAALRKHLVASLRHNRRTPSGGSEDEGAEQRSAQMMDRSLLGSVLARDTRQCVFCAQVGDEEANSSGRLVNVDYDMWTHVNCALWSNEVYETVGGALVNVQKAIQRAKMCTCASCGRSGASVSCFSPKCTNMYHLPCAVSEQCVFLQNKAIFCPAHLSFRNGRADEIIEDKSVLRKVWINRNDLGIIDSLRKRIQPASFESKFGIRIGSLLLQSIGLLNSTEVASGRFSTSTMIYPVGYKAIRFYWSMSNPYKRCPYTCAVHNVDNGPLFVITCREEGSFSETFTSRQSAHHCWQPILERVRDSRKTAVSKRKLLKLYKELIDGNDLFGLTDPVVLRLIETALQVAVSQSIEYVRKNQIVARNAVSRSLLLLNPSGCARSEPIQAFRAVRNLQRRVCALPQRVSPSARCWPTTSVDDNSSLSHPYSKQFASTKFAQYRRLNAESKSNVYLSKSAIQGLGLMSGKDLEKGTMVIECIGEITRNKIAIKREEQYSKQKCGVFMFRLDERHVIDATFAGGLARYVNHSCQPNCVSETLMVDGENKLVIVTNRKVVANEELTLDYRLDVELDDEDRIPCQCGTPGCRKWMN